MIVTDMEPKLFTTDKWFSADIALKSGLRGQVVYFDPLHIWTGVMGVAP